MQVQSGIEPLKDRQQIASVMLKERLVRLGDPYWTQDNSVAPRLKTQTNFTSAVARIEEEHAISLGPREAFLGSMPILSTPQLRLDLVREVSKELCSSQELRSIALATIEERYPPETWLHVYTDGSAQNSTTNAGAGVFSNSFQLSAPVGQSASNFDGEVEAISMALGECLRRADTRVAIFVDSMAALQAVCNARGDDDSSIVRRSKQRAHELISRGVELVLQWIPGHCGVYGNEEADRLAREGALSAQFENSVTYHTSKRAIKTCIMKSLEVRQQWEAEGRKWQSLTVQNGRIPHNLPRQVAVACFRLTTGHDYLQGHLHRIGVFQSPDCVLCGGGFMDGQHLGNCPELEDVRASLEAENCIYIRNSTLYWAARRRMAEVAAHRRGIR